MLCGVCCQSACLHGLCNFVDRMVPAPCEQHYETSMYTNIIIFSGEYGIINSGSGLKHEQADLVALIWGGGGHPVSGALNSGVHSFSMQICNERES